MWSTEPLPNPCLWQSADTCEPRTCREWFWHQLIPTSFQYAAPRALSDLCFLHVLLCVQYLQPDFVLYLSDSAPPALIRNPNPPDCRSLSIKARLYASDKVTDTGPERPMDWGDQKMTLMAGSFLQRTTTRSLTNVFFVSTLKTLVLQQFVSSAVECKRTLSPLLHGCRSMKKQTKRGKEVAVALWFCGCSKEAGLTSMSCRVHCRSCGTNLDAHSAQRVHNRLSFRGLWLGQNLNPVRTRRPHTTAMERSRRTRYPLRIRLKAGCGCAERRLFA